MRVTGPSDRAVSPARDIRPSRRAALIGGAAALIGAALPRAARAQAPEPLSPLLAELYEHAKPEREVTIWGAGSANLSWIPDEFHKRFPAIKLSWMGSRESSTRLIAESRAGRDIVDVWSNSLGGTLELQKRGLLKAMDWQSLGVTPEAVVFGGEGAVEHNYVFSPIFVPARLPEAERPRRWETLLDRAWADRMVASTFHLPRMTAYLAIEWGEDRAREWLRTLLDKQKTLMTTAQVTENLTSGERLLAPAESIGTAFQMRKAGLDIGYLIMDIVPASTFVLNVMKKAPHPNAAKLLVAWLLSPEGKRLNETIAGWADIQSNPESPLTQEVARAGSKIVFETMETMDQRAEYYRRFSAIVRGQG